MHFGDPYHTKCSPRWRLQARYFKSSMANCTHGWLLKFWITTHFQAQRTNFQNFSLFDFNLRLYIAVTIHYKRNQSCFNKRRAPVVVEVVSDGIWHSQTWCWNLFLKIKHNSNVSMSLNSFESYLWYYICLYTYMAYAFSNMLIYKYGICIFKWKSYHL